MKLVKQSFRYVNGVIILCKTSIKKLDMQLKSRRAVNCPELDYLVWWTLKVKNVSLMVLSKVYKVMYEGAILKVHCVGRCLSF